MTEHLSGEPGAGSTPMDRREFVRRAALLALGAAAAPVLAACQIDSPAPAPSPAATNTPAPPTATTALPPPTDTAAPENTHAPTATQQPATATQPPPADTATAAPTEKPAAAATSTAAPPEAAASPTPGSTTTPGRYGVALLAATDRAASVPIVLDMLGFAPGWLKGKNVALKANFNSADPPPGSTHLDTLRALLQRLQDWGAARITLLERSGMGDTRTVLQARGVMSLAKQFGATVVILDDLPAGGWVHMQGAHWKRGFLFPRQVQEADAVVQTCCLKTHRFGGHFTMSLKNSVGLAAKYDPNDGYNYMTELHNSASQRLMIAEINAAYKPSLILLDGVLAFVNGGPDQGKKVQAGLFLASRDRVALDAVAVGMLRHLGTTAEVSRGSIFDQPQISHAASLGIGAPDAGAISLHPAADDASRQLAAVLQKQLAA